MIADEHRRARGPAGIQPTAAVGHDEGAAPRCGGCAHRMNDGLDTMPLIEVGAAQEDEHTCPVRINTADPPRMSDRRGGKESGQ